VGLGGQVVDFVRPGPLYELAQGGLVAEVAVVEVEAAVLLASESRTQLIDARTGDDARPPDDAVDFVAVAEEEFGKVGAILAGYACDQRSASGHVVLSGPESDV